MSFMDSIKGMLGGDGGFDPTRLKELLDQFGGLEGILAKLEEAGLTDKVQSWIGGGDNASISADEVKSALGNENLEAAAQTMGTSTDDIAGKLSELLPGLVDTMSPGGSKPEGGFDTSGVTDAISGFLGQ